MSFFDFFKNMFGKKEPPPVSPSEQGYQKSEPVNGQFATPQNPQASQETTESQSPHQEQTPKPAS